MGDMLIIGERVVCRCPQLDLEVCRGYLLGRVDQDSARVLEDSGLVSELPLVWLAPEYGVGPTPSQPDRGFDTAVRDTLLDELLVASAAGQVYEFPQRPDCRHARLDCYGYLDADGVWVQEWRCKACRQAVPTPIPEDYWEALMVGASVRQGYFGLTDEEREALR